MKNVAGKMCGVGMLLAQPTNRVLVCAALVFHWKFQAQGRLCSFTH